jgi:hypothetical protein
MFLADVAATSSKTAAPGGVLRTLAHRRPFHRSVRELENPPIAHE